MRRLGSSWWWGALSFAGIVATHALTYRVVDHSHGTRHVLLDETFGVAAIVAVLVTFVVRTARSSGPRRLPLRSLALLQGGGWLLVEGIERLGSGHGSLLDRPMLAGLLVQVAVAVVSIVLLTLVAKAVRIVMAVRRRTRPRRSQPRPSIVLNGCWPRLTPAAPRGPPFR